MTFAVGDKVMRRPSTLGEHGRVIEVEPSHGGHQMVTVQFGKRTERLIDDAYIKVER